MIDAIAIQNYGSSGTTFVHSLLDNHPQTLQLPGLRGGEFYNAWRTWVQATGGDTRAIRDHVLTYFAPLSNPSAVGDGWGLQEIGPDRNAHPCVPRDTFVALFDRYLARFAGGGDGGVLTSERLRRYRRACLYAVYHAYEEGRGHDMTAKRFLVYPIHSAVRQDLLDLLEDFSRVSVLHMVRHPLNNLNSLCKYYLKVRTMDDPAQDLFGSAVHALYLDRALNISPARDHERLHGLYYYDDAVRTSSRAVRLEDLHRDPERVMRAVAAWVGLQWDARLLESTFGGLRWWNRPGLSRVSGFSTAIVGKETETYTSAFDERRLAFIGRPVLDAYYPPGPDERRWPAALAALACALPFSLETRWRSPIRDVLILGRGLRRIAPGYAAALEQRALAAFTRQKADYDPAFHVLVPNAGAMTSDTEIATMLGGPLLRACARGYASIADYVRHRWQLVRAVRFVRRQAHRHVTPLLDPN
jgi:hypothetical protein